MFDKVSFENGINVAAYRVDSLEADWHSAEGGHGHYVPLHGGYHAIPPKDQLYNLRTRIVTVLEEMGVPVKYHHHEVGGGGQHEMACWQKESSLACGTTDTRGTGTRP